MAVDYTPTLGTYTELKPFRYWCQKVLPLVYDDSLSYYELLCKVVDYLNKTMEDVETLHDDVEGLHTAYEQLQEYVNTYFDNLDVQEEINNKLDAMASSGALSTIIAPFIPDLVTAWLDENITPTTPVIDETLSVSGAGADAKVTGVMLKPINEAFHTGINLFNALDSVNGIVLKNDGTELESVTGYTSNFIPVKAGDTYQKRYRFDSATIADVVFYDSSFEYLNYSSLPSNRIFTVPEGCAYIKITGYISNKDIEYLINTGWGSAYQQKYRKVLAPFSGGGDHIRIIASQPLYIDTSATPYTIKTVAQNPSTSSLYVQVPGLTPHTISLPASISGTGSYLWYDYTAKAFYADNNYYNSDTYPARYFVANISNTDSVNFELNKDLFNIVSAKPILFLDFLGRTLTVKIDTSVYVWYKNTYTTLTQETYTLSLPASLSSIELLYFDFRTNKFTTGTTFTLSQTTLRYTLPIGFIYGGMISSIVPIINTATQLGGRSICTFGDSLTWYDGHAYTWGPDEGVTCFGYQSYLKTFYGANIANWGSSGKTTPQICSMLTDNLEELADNSIVTIMGGDNDDRTGVTVGTLQTPGSTFDTTTVYGALQNAIETALTNNPTLRIVLMTEPVGWTYRTNAMVRVNANIPKAYRDVAQLYSLPLIDLWNTSGINEYTVDTYYCDPTDNHLYKYHPNNKGWDRISRMICNELLKV